jgi:hypothetical protein
MGLGGPWDGPEMALKSPGRDQRWPRDDHVGVQVWPRAGPGTARKKKGPEKALRRPRKGSKRHGAKPEMTQGRPWSGPARALDGFKRWTLHGHEMAQSGPGKRPGLIRGRP